MNAEGCNDSTLHLWKPQLPAPAPLYTATVPHNISSSLLVLLRHDVSESESIFIHLFYVWSSSVWRVLGCYDTLPDSSTRWMTLHSQCTLTTGLMDINSSHHTFHAQVIVEYFHICFLVRPLTPQGSIFIINGSLITKLCLTLETP